MIGNKVQKVMHEFKKGKLNSSSGQKVVDRKQAIAIALSEEEREKKAKSKAVKAGLSAKGRK